MESEYDVFLGDDVEKARQIIYEDESWFDLNIALEIACEGGNRNIVKLLLDNGANSWEFGFYNACVYGYLEIVEILVDLVPVKSLYSGLCDAIENCHRDVADLILSRSNINKPFCSASIIISGWTDLLVCNMYRGGLEYRALLCTKNRYDIIDIFDIIVDKINIKVKLFDQNLFFLI